MTDDNPEQPDTDPAVFPAADVPGPDLEAVPLDTPAPEPAPDALPIPVPLV